MIGYHPVHWPRAACLRSSSGTGWCLLSVAKSLRLSGLQTGCFAVKPEQVGRSGSVTQEQPLTSTSGIIPRRRLSPSKYAGFLILLTPDLIVSLSLRRAAVALEVDLFVLSAENEAHLLNELQSVFRLLRNYKCYPREKETFKETSLGCKNCASYFFK